MPRRLLACLVVAAIALYTASIIVGPPRRRVLAVKAPASAPPVDAGIRVTFWNVEWFPGRRPNASANARAAHLAAVAPVIERLNPDILGLEEVADYAAAKSIADHVSGMRVDVCSAFLVPDSATEIGKQQVVLCSRLPLLQAWAEPWKPGVNGVQPRRGFVFAAYQPAPGEVLLAYGVHLKSNRADTPGGAADNFAMRQESARQLTAHAQAMQAAYRAMGRVTVMVGGDMNTSFDDPQFASETTLPDLQRADFRWVWTDVPFSQRVTLPSEGRYGAACFDHLFLLGSTYVFADPRVELTGRDCSDHRPVFAALVSAPSP